MVLKTTFAADSGTCASETACVSLTSTYDGASRRKSLAAKLDGADSAHYNLSAGETQTQSWEYDGLGRILKATDDNAGADDAVVRYLYDSLGHARQEQWHEDGSGDPLWSVAAEYDTAGRLQQLSYPDIDTPHYAGATLKYTYDEIQRLTELTDLHAAGPEDDEAVHEATYTGASRLRELTHSDGTLWRSHDGAGTELRDRAGRRTGAQVAAPGGVDVWFEEKIGYDANDRVTRVEWPHGRSGATQSEAQEYLMDELGRLKSFKQGLFENGQLDENALTTQHEWKLDEQGNWREHREDPANSFLTPGLDIVKAYTNWPVPFDNDNDGTPDVLTRTHDAVRGFLYEKQTLGGGQTRYTHDPFGRLTRVQEDDDGKGENEIDVEYGYTPALPLSACRGGTVCGGAGW